MAQGSHGLIHINTKQMAYAKLNLLASYQFMIMTLQTTGWKKKSLVGSGLDEEAELRPASISHSKLKPVITLKNKSNSSMQDLGSSTANSHLMKTTLLWPRKPQFMS